MTFLDLAPIARAAGTVSLPGSKSITNRVMLLAALAEGTTLVRDPLQADDTTVMLEALRRLGIPWIARADGAVSVPGAGGPFTVRQADLFLGNAGTVFRPLTAVLALCGGEYRLSGAPRMHERPIGDLVEALNAHGASIDYLGARGYPPLAIHAGAVRAGGTVEVRGDVSSQFLTALLMALPLCGGNGGNGGSALLPAGGHTLVPAGGNTLVRVRGELISRPYVEITLNLMRRFGVAVARDGWREFAVPAGRYKSPGELYVEGDASSASYFLAAGAISGLSGGGPVRVKGVGRASIQGDVRFVEVLRRMGARIAMGEDWIEAAAGPEAVATGKLRALDADLNHIPDAAMTAAVAALFADGTSVLRNIASWRVKETDRIAAMANELRKLGATVEEGADFLRITPPHGSRLAEGASIDTYEDHRMAMCFSLVALGGVTVRINDPDCVAKTFPEYFGALASISTA